MVLGVPNAGQFRFALVWFDLIRLRMVFVFLFWFFNLFIVSSASIFFGWFGCGLGVHSSCLICCFWFGLIRFGLFLVRFYCFFFSG